MKRYKINLNKSSIQSYVRDVLPTLGLKNRQQKFLWFDQPTGLGLRIIQTSSSEPSINWVYQGRVKGTSKVSRVTLKTAYIPQSQASIEQAREECLTLIECARGGVDPNLQRQKEQIEQLKKDRQTALVNDAKSRRLYEYYMEYIEACKCHWGSRYIKDHFSFVQAGGGELKFRGRTRTGKRVAGPLHELMQLAPIDFTRAWVMDWIRREVQIRPTSFAGSFRVLKAFVRWMDESENYHGLIDPLTVRAREVSRLVPKAKTKDRVLMRAQLKPWIKVVFELDSYLASRAILMTFLTGARVMEVLSMEWKYVDLHWGTLTIRDKDEGQRTIPITRMMRRIFEELKRHNEAKSVIRFRAGKLFREPSAFVFFSERSASGHMCDISVALQQSLVQAGIKALSAHDLRRTYTTLSEWAEIPPGAVAQIQGHKPSATVEKHYKKRPIDLLAMFSQRYEDWLIEQTGMVELMDKHELAFESLGHLSCSSSDLI